MARLRTRHGDTAFGPVTRATGRFFDAARTAHPSPACPQPFPCRHPIMSPRFAMASLVAACSCAMVPAHADGLRMMSDSELSEVSGQALLNLTNTSLNGLDFTRITLGADIQLSANLSRVRLGE